MKSESVNFLLPVLATAFFTGACNQTSPVKEPGKPNIIFILADDLGYGDLSCYGQTHFQTPNIDQLAAYGMRFTQHYSGSTVCAPSRSSLMTGLHTGHTPIRGNKEWKPEGQWPMPDSTFTIAEMLKKAGYVTGAFGKWGLGYPSSEGDPNRQGFDIFYGYNCQRIGHNYYPYHVWHNQEKVILEGNEDHEQGTYAPADIHQHALKFLEDNKDKPFFMYYPTIIPHAELFAPEEYMQKYRGKYEPELNFEGVDDGPGYKNGGYGSQPDAHAAFAAMINVLDNHVGEIIAKLKELGIADNTLVIFTSDNGPHLEGGADPDFFDSNGPLKGYKRDLYEGGMRVPMIAWYPGKIAAGTESKHISAFWDVMPTIAELAGLKAPENIDGISFLPALLGKEGQKEHEYMYWEFHEKGGRLAVRKGDWKAVRYNVLKGEEPTQLYNLAEDIGEKNNLAAQHPEIVNDLEEIMKNARTESDVFQFKPETYVAQ
ncbi:MAG: arylsulfatase [Bacteroidetes bacterium GWF2_42_66]|nr:MAG: arylsulfatase [Bacteroidetes bacterium GWA2_42_15]OFY01935.1 MAG: arylsulfatase [Bacteroidetes bacterium GWE2_42_39]OFY44769.1 MAG: arylsulfatase [Bacteroidetes bacterium GWF2_42_66]HBL75893.1 arylsulfatase [Prolixibacteraceae bacterium]HCR89138.1 arylsulfatase [Prolixibacteraceae bacterium]